LRYLLTQVNSNELIARGGVSGNSRGIKTMFDTRLRAASIFPAALAGGFSLRFCGHAKSWPVRGSFSNAPAADIRRRLPPERSFRTPGPALPLVSGHMVDCRQKIRSQRTGTAAGAPSENYATAWTWLNKLRHAMAASATDPLTGTFDWISALWANSGGNVSSPFRNRLSWRPSGEQWSRGNSHAPPARSSPAAIALLSRTPFVKAASCSGKMVCAAPSVRCWLYLSRGLRSARVTRVVAPRS